MLESRKNLAKAEIAAEKTIYSAGDGKTTEIVRLENGQKGFAIWNTGSATFVQHSDYVHPLKDEAIAWDFLPGMPIDFKNEYELYKELRSFIYDHLDMPKNADLTSDSVGACILQNNRVQQLPLSMRCKALKMQAKLVS